MQEDGKYPVDLLINTVDTWNIVAIPRPQYSSNTGFEITLKARDYNFLGTMRPLRLDIGYELNEERKSTLLLMLDSNTPLRLFGFNWNLKFVNFFNYRPDTEKPFYFMNTTGLSIELPVNFTTVTIGFDESFFINQENDHIDKPLYGNFQDGFYMSSNPYIAWRIPTGLEIGPWGEIVYTPRFSAVFNHEFPQWPLDELRKGPFLSFRHNLRFNRVDWIGNFQRGLDVFANNSVSYNFYKARNDLHPWTGTLTASGTGHYLINHFMGISGRLMYRHWFLYDMGFDEAANVMRGILNRKVNADYMLSLNLDFPIRVLRFSPSTWFGNQNLRIFNFDLHMAPIMDAALFHDPVKNTSFCFSNILVTGGMEVVVFPEFFRSLFLRVSVGWNLKEMGSGTEIFIGTDFHY
jgi:hypothetical protein